MTNGQINPIRNIYTNCIIRCDAQFDAIEIDGILMKGNAPAAPQAPLNIATYIEVFWVVIMKFDNTLWLGRLVDEAATIDKIIIVTRDAMLGDDCWQHTGPNLTDFLK